MSKRQIKGFILQRDGVLAPNTPMKCSVKLPVNAKVHDVMIDANGTFVQLAEVEAHREGEKVKFKEVAYTMLPTNVDIPNGLTYVKSLVHGPAVFHVFSRAPGSVIDLPPGSRSKGRLQ